MESNDGKVEGTKNSKAKSNWFGVAIGGALVAAVTGGFPLVAGFLTEDLTRCDLATRFFTDFAVKDIYTADELDRLKGIYLDTAALHCRGD